MSDWKENVTGEMPCKPFDMVDVWFRDGDLSSGFASDFYWKIDHDIADIIKYKVRYNKTETPEEKEALDSMSKSDSDNIHKPSWAKWSIGDDVTKIKGSSWTGKVVGYYSTCLTIKGYAVESSTEKGSVQIYPEAALRSAESPEQKAERERLEAAYDLYVAAQESLNVIGYESFQQFTSDEVQVKFWLSIVDKTGYRKAK